MATSSGGHAGADEELGAEVQRKLLAPDAGCVKKWSRKHGKWMEVCLLARMDLRWLKTKGRTDLPKDTKAWVGKGRHIGLVRGKTQVEHTEGEKEWTVVLGEESEKFMADDSELAKRWVAALKWRVCSWTDLLQGQGPSPIGELGKASQASWPLRMAHLEEAQSSAKILGIAAQFTSEVLGKLPFVGPALSVLGFALEVACRVQGDIDGFSAAQSNLERIANRAMETLERVQRQQTGDRLNELAELMGVIEEGARQLEGFEFQSTVRMMVHGVFRDKSGPRAVVELAKQCEQRLAAYEVHDSNAAIHDTNRVVQDTSEKVDALPEQVAAAVKETVVQVLPRVLSRKVSAKVRRKVHHAHSTTLIPTQVVTIAQEWQVARVKRMLLEGTTRYVAVLGMGGVGKTTLARSIVNDRDVQERFRKSDEKGCLGLGFVTISQYPNILECQKKIWEALFGEKVEFANVGEGKWKLEAILQDKTYFLVMDDVWDETDIVRLDVAPSNSRVLITSRDDKVARAVGARCYDVTPLDDKASRQLFCKHAFDGGMPKRWQESHIPAIIQKCDGLPLALEIMGRQAHSFKKRQQWRDAVEILAESKMLKEQLFDHVFGLSFNSMSPVHQEVLLDMAMLPEDHQTKATDMVELQVSIGLCASECTAQEVLSTLEDKALLRQEGNDVSEVPEFDHSSVGVRYYLHDVVRDSALRTIAKKSLLERERLVSSHLRQGICRNQVLMATRFSTSQRIRTDQPWALRDLEMPGLQVLMLRDAGISELPSSLCTAQLLAVDLTSSGITELPSQVSCLQSVKVFRLDYCDRLVGLPSEVGGMLNLQVLSMRGCMSIYKIPESLGNLSMLTKLLVPKCGVSYLCHPDMKLWHNLTMLDLSRCTALKHLPSNIGDLASLTALNLGGCVHLRCLPTSIGQLGRLEVLVLHRCNCLAELPDTMANLASLQELDVQCCPQLASIPSTIGDRLSDLRILRLQGNEHMAFPEFLEDLECLQVLGLPEECAIPDAFKATLEDQEIVLETRVTKMCELSLDYYIPLHWGALNGMDEMVKFHLCETDVDIDVRWGKTALMWASEGGHTSTVDLLLKHSASVDKADRWGLTALKYASQGGHTSTVDVLLKHSASVDKDDEYGITALMWASKGGHTSTVDLLLKHSASVDKADLSGCTALMYASQGGHTSTVDLLLKHNASVDKASKLGRTALMFASQGGHTSTVDLLLKHSASVDMADEHGRTALMMASENGHTSTVDLLLRHSASVDKVDMDGRTALMKASVGCHTSTVDLLLGHSASVDKADWSGWTALMKASEGGHTSTVDLLLKHSASVDKAERSGWTALMKASEGGHASTVDLLLKHSASVDKADRSGCTALMKASQGGHTSTVDLLLKHSTSVDRADEFGWTALMKASEGGHTSTVDMLLKHSASVDKADESGWTALMKASEGGHTSTVDLLLKHSASVDKADELGRTALMMASENGHTSTVDLLLKHSASVDKADEFGWTALMKASEGGHTSTIELLLKHSASVDKADERDCTALMWASRRGHTSTIDLLLKHSASVDMADWLGRTALMWASKGGHTGTVDLLLKHSASVDKANQDGKTAADLARAAGHHRLAEKLCDAG